MVTDHRIIFAVLGVAVYLCTGAFGDEIHQLDVYDTVRDLLFPMPNPTGVQHCVVTTNDDVTFSLLPRDENVPAGIQIEFSEASSLGCTCTMQIARPTIQHSGMWTIRAYTGPIDEDDVTVKRFSLNFTGTDLESEEDIEKTVSRHIVPVFPSRKIVIFPENTMTLRMVNHYEHMTKCVAISPEDQEFDALNTGNDLDNNIRSFDQCGVMVRINNNHAGEWRLEATIENDTIGRSVYYGTFNVQVEHPRESDSEPTVTYVQNGAATSVSAGPSDAVSCQLMNPKGRNYPMQSGNCDIDIPIVTKAHEGIWTARYSLRGEVDVVKEMMRLVTYDDRSFNATVTTTDNGEVNLLCSARAYSYSFCQFVSPNGEVLNMFEGIGNDRYRYYGNGYRYPSILNHGNHECGITILRPNRSDYGSWKCILGTSSGLRGSILRVSAPGADANKGVHTSFPDDVYAVRGDSFTVKCSANVELKYCWLRSPNGTAYSVSSIANSPTTLRYSGLGLSFGECGAVISAAEDTDEGNWYCGMGVYNGREVRSTVTVIVTDTLLVPSTRNVTTRRNEAQLHCFLTPGYEGTIDYCRWIQPGGFGMEHWTSSVPYKQELFNAHSSSRSCYLELRNVKENWDTGKWTCVAGLVGSSTEVSATIEVSRESRPVQNPSLLKSWAFGIGLGFVSIIFGCILLLVVRHKLRLRSIEKARLPPSYESQHVGMPPVTTPPTQSRI